MYKFKTILLKHNFIRNCCLFSQSVLCKADVSPKTNGKCMNMTILNLRNIINVRNYSQPGKNLLRNSNSKESMINGSKQVLQM